MNTHSRLIEINYEIEVITGHLIYINNEICYDQRTKEAKLNVTNSILLNLYNERERLLNPFKRNPTYKMCIGCDNSFEIVNDHYKYCNRCYTIIYNSQIK